MSYAKFALQGGTPLFCLLKLVQLQLKQDVIPGLLVGSQVPALTFDHMKSCTATVLDADMAQPDK